MNLNVCVFLFFVFCFFFYCSLSLPSSHFPSLFKTNFLISLGTLRHTAGRSYFSVKSPVQQNHIHHFSTIPLVLLQSTDSIQLMLAENVFRLQDEVVFNRLV
jgi:hypothetical protein